MNKEFRKYDKTAWRMIYIKIDDLNRILSNANAGVKFLHRNVELQREYEAYLHNAINDYEVPLSIEIFEERYFRAKSSVETSGHTPGSVLICRALELKNVAYVWAKDLNGRELDDELEFSYKM